jgi:hypothetical protein
LPASYWLFLLALVPLAWFAQSDRWASRGARGAVRERSKGIVQNVVELLANIGLTSLLILPFQSVAWWVAILSLIAAALASGFAFSSLTGWLRFHPPEAGDFVDLYGSLAPWFGVVGAALTVAAWYQLSIERAWIS